MTVTLPCVYCNIPVLLWKHEAAFPARCASCSAKIAFAKAAERLLKIPEERSACADGRQMPVHSPLPPDPVKNKEPFIERHGNKLVFAIFFLGMPVSGLIGLLNPTLGCIGALLFGSIISFGALIGPLLFGGKDIHGRRPDGDGGCGS